MERYAIAVMMTLLLTGVVGGAARATDTTGGAAVDFARDIQPILEERCYRCHGPEEQKNGLRLDVKAEALRGGESGRVIIPGDSESSLLYQFVAGLDPDTSMPAEGDPVTTAELVLIKRWIDEGAQWPDETQALAASMERAVESNHWSFRPIQRPPVPAVRNGDWARSPIDHFVLARLEGEGITPSPEADRTALIRRLSLDLVGLPPTPAEVNDFVNDPSPYAYERVVSRLLASPHFGEHWGRHWLDLARYADSDGFEKDEVRPHAWRYRQWVIDSLNRDMPYDQFVIEQLAGDLLPGATLEQQVATGFHRNTLTNREGGVDVEQFRVEQIVDRVNTTAAVFMGLTMACAQCHNHKFDPLTQREYYGLFAFFNGGMEKDIPAPLDSEVTLYARTLENFEKRQHELQEAISKYEPELEARLPEWEAQLSEDLSEVTWSWLEPASMSSAGGATFTRLEDGSILVGGNSPVVDTYTVVVTTRLEDITGFRLEVLTDPSLPRTGPGRAHHGNFILSEFLVNVSKLSSPAAKRVVRLVDAWTDFWEEGWPISEAIDGDPTTGWSIDAWRGYNENRSAVFVTDEAVGHPDGTTLTFTFDHQYGTSHAIGRFRLFAATGAREHLTVTPSIPRILATTPEERTQEQNKELLEYFGTFDPKMRELRTALEAHENAKPELNATYAQIIVENPEQPKTHIHIRGDFLRKGEEVHPHTPAILPPLVPRSGSANRLDLARWLMHPDHPLTSRVAANRVWEHIFGRGLVYTSEDFGTRGETPSHPDLLDWLATQYMAKGWSTKEMIKLIVSSATYRQVSRARPDLLDRDPMNNLLARQNRFRVKAETIRDLFLSCSGLLNLAVGGPSVRPPLPAGVAELGFADSVKWRESQGANQYRRGIYIHFQRTVPYPMLMTFDCPDSNVTAIRRARSNTPLQALTLLNDPVFFECAQALGRRVFNEAAGNVKEGIRHAFRLCLAREPDAQEMDRLVELWKAEFDALSGNGETALGIAGRYLPEGAQPEQVAPWITLGRAIMNLDEFVTRE